MSKPTVVETRDVKLSDVKFSQATYPREKPSTRTVGEYLDAIKAGEALPPIRLDQDGLELLDGYHRVKATQESGATTIRAEIVALGEYPRLLYAAACNSQHGDRLTSAEKRAVAQQMMPPAETPSNLVFGRGLGQPQTADAIRFSPRVTQEEIAKVLGVSAATMSDWVGDIGKANRRVRDAQVWWLSLLGWTQREVAEATGLSLGEVNATCSESSGLKKLNKEQAGRGRTSVQIADALGVPVKVLEAMSLDGKDDTARCEWLKMNVQPYDVWTFSGCDPRFGGDYPGRVPGQLLLHTLYFYTEPGDLVVDPMVGGGTTLDACAYLGRKCYGFDAHPAPGQTDILEHDLTTGWPDRVKRAALVFWDPPYFSKMDAGYGDKSVSRLGRKEYLAFFVDRAKELRSLTKGRLAFLCSDFNEEDQPAGDIFFWEYVKLFEAAGWQARRRTQVPLTTQAVHPGIVTDFRAKRRQARLGRDLVVFV